MTTAVLRTLRLLGVPKTEIHAERGPRRTEGERKR